VNEPAAPIVLDLVWEGSLLFKGTAEKVGIVLDSAGQAGPSPVQALAFALAGCMAMDVVHILAKGRSEPATLTARLVGRRAAEDPRRLVKVDLHFKLSGPVQADRVERAIALSREKYCSVWHSMREDIELATSFELVDGAPSR
jgi:putative redox protein